ncbi:MAG: hypothetical protein ACI9DE_001505, partial [Halioglobus sp.]
MCGTPVSSIMESSYRVNRSFGNQAGKAPCKRAAVRVFSIRQAIVIGPVPPGIG